LRLSESYDTVKEAFDAVAGVLSADRVGVRIAPYRRFNDMNPDSKVEETFLYLADELTRGAAFTSTSLAGDSSKAAPPAVPEAFLANLRTASARTVMLTGGLTQAIAEQLLAENSADLFAFGTLLISNPDLP